MLSHGWYQLAPFRWDGKVLHRGDLRISHRNGALVVGQMEDSRPRLSGQRRAAVLHAQLIRMFQLNVPLDDFHRLAAESPNHEWTVKAGFGRLLCGATLFEDAIKIIATTNTTWRQTVRMIGLLVEKCGRGGAFPEPGDIARFSIADLQRDCRLGYRATSMHRLAAGIVEGSIDLERLSDPQQTTDALYRSYLTLPGIGPYGAAHLLAMDGRHDFIAVDTEFRRFVRETYHQGRRVSDATMLRRYGKWGRWKYMAYWADLWGSVAERLQRMESAGE